MPRNANFWQVGVLDIVLSEYLDKSYKFPNFIFMTSSPENSISMVMTFSENFAKNVIVIWVKH